MTVSHLIWNHNSEVLKGSHFNDCLNQSVQNKVKKKKTNYFLNYDKEVLTL